MARRKQLAAVAFRKLWSLWVRHYRVYQDLRRRLSNAFITPVLTYNTGTWGLTPTEWARFDAFHLQQLRQVIAIRYPQRISNNALYRKCACNPLSLSTNKALWCLDMCFSCQVKQLAIDQYFTSTDVAGWRVLPRTKLPTVLDKDLQEVGKRLRNLADI